MSDQRGLNPLHDADITRVAAEDGYESALHDWDELQRAGHDPVGSKESRAERAANRAIGRLRGKRDADVAEIADLDTLDSYELSYREAFRTAYAEGLDQIEGDDEYESEYGDEYTGEYRSKEGEQE
jgi:hypothetical protein